MYDPRLGRWLTEDPIGFTAADANPTSYLRNAPLNATDPQGLQQRVPFGRRAPAEFRDWNSVFDWMRGDDYPDSNTYRQLTEDDFTPIIVPPVGRMGETGFGTVNVAMLFRGEFGVNYSYLPLGSTADAIEAEQSTRLGKLKILCLDTRMKRYMETSLHPAVEDDHGLVTGTVSTSTIDGMKAYFGTRNTIVVNPRVNGNVIQAVPDWRARVFAHEQGHLDLAQIFVIVAQREIGTLSASRAFDGTPGSKARAEQEVKVMLEQTATYLFTTACRAYSAMSKWWDGVAKSSDRKLPNHTKLLKDLLKKAAEVSDLSFFPSTAFQWKRAISTPRTHQAFLILLDKFHLNTRGIRDAARIAQEWDSADPPSGP